MREFLSIFLVNAVLALALTLAFGVLIGLVILAQYFMGLVGALVMVILIIVLIGSLLEWSRKRAKK